MCKHFSPSCIDCEGDLQGTVLDGHKLALQLSMRKPSGAGQQKDARSETKAGSSGRGTKLVVRNVAFEATRKDLMALFTPFGQIKSCRLPKKMDGNHRCLFSQLSPAHAPRILLCEETSGRSRTAGALRGYWHTWAHLVYDALCCLLQRPYGVHIAGARGLIVPHSGALPCCPFHPLSVSVPDVCLALQGVCLRGLSEQAGGPVSSRRRGRDTSVRPPFGELVSLFVHLAVVPCAMLSTLAAVHLLVICWKSCSVLVTDRGLCDMAKLCILCIHFSSKAQPEPAVPCMMAQ